MYKILVVAYVIYVFILIPTDGRNEIIMTFYHCNNFEDTLQVPPDDVEEFLRELKYDGSITSAIYVLGYNQSIKEYVAVDVLSAYFQQENSSVFSVDYIQLTKFPLTDYERILEELNKFLSKVLPQMINYGVPRDNIHLIGQSASGRMVGKFVQKNLVGLTVGLDPSPWEFDENLDVNETECDIAIRTDQGCRGTDLRNCKLELISNFGKRSQPGCGPTLGVFKDFYVKSTVSNVFTKEELNYDLCSHFRAGYLWAEIIRSPNSIIAIECTDPHDFVTGRCSNNSILKLGPAMKGMTGTYYFLTNWKSPYALGWDGLPIDYCQFNKCN